MEESAEKGWKRGAVGAMPRVTCIKRDNWTSGGVLPAVVVYRRPRGSLLTFVLLHRHRIEEKFSTAPLAFSEQQNSHLIRSETQRAVSTTQRERMHIL